MKILPESRGGSFCLLLVVLLCSVAQPLGREVEVVGYAESTTIKNPHAFSGLQVTIDCKKTETKDHFVTRGSGEVDETGKFTLSIPHDIVGDDGTLKESCYAQLHSASGNPCPANDGLEASKIVVLSKSGEKHVLGLKQNLKFSPEVCASKFFWHMHKFKFPSLTLPPLPKFKKPCLPKIKFPPLVPIYKPPVVIIKKPCPPKIKPPVVIPKKPSPPKIKPPVVIPKKPSPPKIKPPVVIPKKPSPPKIKPPVVIPKKPCPPKASVPIHKPSVPIHKPIHKPSVPIHKPIYKPPVTIHKPIYKLPVPFFKPPFVIPKKPCPPKIPLPPLVIPKKPCPPLFKLPTLPPKFKIPHPKFGKWPSLPSHP